MLSSADEPAAGGSWVERCPEEQLLRRLVREVQALRAHALAVEERYTARVETVLPNHRRSARNLLHYLALRSYDLRELQEALAPLGLSSLGRTEAHALASLNAVSRLLQHELGDGTGRLGQPSDVIGFEEGQRLADAHAEALLGPCPPERPAIMVTLPKEAGDDPRLARELIATGVDAARINCAHDGPDTWQRMAANVREASRESGRACLIQMDLAGPKLRTGALEPGPRVVRWRPTRDLRGRVCHPARIWLAPADALPPAGEPVGTWLPVEAAWLESVSVGDCIRLRDARGRKRDLEVVSCDGPGRWAECDRTGYVETGTELRLKGSDLPSTRVGHLPPRELSLLLRRGDRLILCAGGEPGRAAVPDGSGGLLPARIPCSLPEVLPRIRPGETVKFDDGKIEAEVRRVSEEGVEVEITRARPGGSKLRADKGINLPDSDLGLPGLTEKDRVDLRTVIELADVVGLSFVKSPEDVLELKRELAALGAQRLGIMLKIETRQAFEQLPWVLLAAMSCRAAGVLIARGDLAVECGWERMAEVQEEILWFCEAAHMPVVWATQVLESLAKQGFPSRAEITDAAMAVRAECVMLNKGPHIVDAIETLDDILRRMRGHQHKKTPRLRSLKLSSDVAPNGAS